MTTTEFQSHVLFHLFVSLDLFHFLFCVSMATAINEAATGVFMPELLRSVSWAFSLTLKLFLFSSLLEKQHAIDLIFEANIWATTEISMHLTMPEQCVYKLFKAMRIHGLDIEWNALNTQVFSIQLSFPLKFRFMIFIV